MASARRGPGGNVVVVAGGTVVDGRVVVVVGGIVVVGKVVVGIVDGGVGVLDAEPSHAASNKTAASARRLISPRPPHLACG
jgi:hypothetical protein